MKKRIVALLLATSMVVTCFAGCGKNNTEDEKLVTHESFNETGYPVVDEEITLTVLCPVATSRAGGLNENEAILKFEEITGVNLEFTEVASSEWGEELGLTLASGELPDIILGDMGSTDLADSIRAGNIIDLKPYIEAYGDNIKALMGKVEGMKESMTLPSGEIASLPYMNMMTESGKCPQSMLYVYQPWMDKLGLKTPTTAQEFYDVLVAFKTKDPNGNGKADEIPFLPRNLDNFYELFGLFGIVVQKGNYFQAIDDEIIFTPSTKNFKDGLTYLRKLYEEGLVNKDVITDGNSETLAKGSGDVAVAGATLSAAAFATVGEERQNDMTLVEYIAADGYDMKWLNRKVVNSGRFMITKDCKYPEIALRVWDYLFSEEGSALYWMGDENNYTWNADHSAWTWNLAEGQTVEELRGTKTLQTTYAMAGGFCSDWFKQDAGSETKANYDRVTLGTKYADYLGSAIPHGLQYEKEAAEERSIYLTDLNTYVNSALAQFITGKLDIEKDWDSFIEQCNAMKVDEVIRITQEAYDAYIGK